MELSEWTNTKYVAMDMYAILFILVGRNIVNSSIRRGGNGDRSGVSQKVTVSTANQPSQLVILTVQCNTRQLCGSKAEYLQILQRTKP